MSSAVISRAETLIAELEAMKNPDDGTGRVRRYLRGDHDLPYVPRGAKTEYHSIARKSITNWLPLISDTYVKGLFVDGYRAAKETENAAGWRQWQLNKMDARQTITTRGTLDYGTAYVLVLKGKKPKTSVIKPLQALSAVAHYEDVDDEWPVDGLRFVGTSTEGATLYEYIDHEHVHSISIAKGESTVKVVASAKHGMGVCPLVRFRDRLDGEPVGIVAPLISIQDRINEAVFALMIALQYASFRQRWATGLAIPVDEDEFLEDGETPNPNYGQPVEPFAAAVDRLWVTDNHEAKFGDFAQTDTSNHLDAYGSSVRTLAAIAQLSPHVLLGDLVNLSADALAAAEAATQRKIGEYETLFGEAWEQVLRLAAHAAGEGTADETAQVRWRDTEARSLAAAVDALGKMVQMLGVPAQAAWERIPGVTDQDIQRWRGMASSDGMRALADALARQTTPTAPATAETG